MSYLSSINHGLSPTAPAAPASTRGPTPTAAADTRSSIPATRGQDQVTLSPQARAASQAPHAPQTSPPLRPELVERVRGQILAGTYETPGKYQAAFEAMVEAARDV